MAYSALIDDLEKQFAENPRRVFARLANEYRKAGDLERAIAYCRAHIPTAPSYISGYIVLGQALYESQRFEEARQAFETALNLDPENLIALRQLGDIARQNGDNESARAWYQRLLEVDPQNDEIVAHLNSLAPRPRADAAGWWPSDNAIGWHGVMQSGAADVPATDNSYGAPAPEAPAASQPQAELAAGAIGHGDGIAEHEPLDQYLSDAELFAPETYLPLSDPADQHAPTIDALAPDTDAADSAGLEREEPAPFMSDDMAVFARDSYDNFGNVDLAPNESEGDAETAGVDAAGETHAVAPMYDPTIGRQVDFAARESQAPAFVTETMADLYLQQGFTGEAIAIYRQLVDENPDDDSLRRRLTEVERLAVPSSSALESEASATPDVRRSNVRRVFSGLAARRAPRRADGNGSSNGADAPAAAGMFGETQVSPADDSAAKRLAGAFSEQYREPSTSRSSLQMLFGDSVEISDDAPPGHAPESATVSFDEFFAGAPPREERSAAAPGTDDQSETSIKTDLDTFHAWLGGLKQ
ncbi:MAG: tetratricopeptide repeat protein [Gemmatimonadaceae bacterium]